MAALAAVSLLVKAMPLRPGDRLNVRAPIEDEDFSPNNLDEQTYVRNARQRVGPNVTRRGRHARTEGRIQARAVDTGRDRGFALSRSATIKPRTAKSCTSPERWKLTCWK
jgi:hypothetical protein